MSNLYLIVIVFISYIMILIRVFNGLIPICIGYNICSAILYLIMRSHLQQKPLVKKSGKYNIAFASQT